MKAKLQPERVQRDAISLHAPAEYLDR